MKDIIISPEVSEIKVTAEAPAPIALNVTQPAEIVVVISEVADIEDVIKTASSAEEEAAAFAGGAKIVIREDLL